MKRSFLAAALFAFVCFFTSTLTIPAHADTSLSAIGMGHGAGSEMEFRQFLAAVKTYSASGQRFHIDTNCPSACTMFLAVRNVCIDPGATLSFHAGGLRGGAPMPRVTGIMLAKYKPALQKYLTSNHYMDTFEYHSISGSEMISRFGYPACR